MERLMRLGAVWLVVGCFATLPSSFALARHPAAAANSGAQAHQQVPPEHTQHPSVALATSLQGIATEIKATRQQLAKPPQESYSDYIGTAGLLATLLAAVLSAYWASRSAYLLAANRSQEEKRLFCFELQRQFDAPDMFQCRYKAWLKLNPAELGGVTKVSELLSSQHWTYDVSTVIHFFESLSRYCDEGLVDKTLAARLFGRSYRLWYDGLLSRLELDEAARPSHEWFNGLLAFHVHLKPSTSKRPAPLSIAQYLSRRLQRSSSS